MATAPDDAHITTFFAGFEWHYARGDVHKTQMAELLKAFAYYWMASDADKNNVKMDVFKHLEVLLIGQYDGTKTFKPGVFGLMLDSKQGTLAKHTYDAIAKVTTSPEDKAFIMKAADVLFTEMQPAVIAYTRDTPGDSREKPPRRFMDWLKHVGKVFGTEKKEREKRDKDERLFQQRLVAGESRTRSGGKPKVHGHANSEYYNELNAIYYNNLDYRSLFDDDIHSLPFDDHSHPLISGEYIDGSGSGSSLLIGGVVGASAVVIIMLIFCLGLAFGMIIYWGYSQKRALDVKRKKGEMRNWIEDDEDRNEV
eukprot:579343_1